MAAPQLTVGRYQPTNAPTGSASGGGFQPGMYGMAVGSGHGPGSWYGGQYQHPMIPSGYTTASDPSNQAGSATTIPTIQLPQGTPAVPAFTPDYSSMIGGSWEVGAAESMMAEQMAAARARLQASLRTGLIDLGVGDASQLGNLSKYIDKATIQKAIDNKYSTYAQIKQQQDVANAFNQGDLIARGLGTSGTATETTSDTIQRAEQARYEGLRNFLQAGQTGLDNMAALKAQLAGQVMNARFAAAQRLAQMYPPTPAQPAVEPDWNDFWGSYQGGTWAMPGGGYIVPSGIPNADGSPQPWYVGRGSGTGGDLSWLPGYMS